MIWFTKLGNWLAGAATPGSRRNTLLAGSQAIVGAVALFISYRLIIAFHGLGQIGLWSVMLAAISVIRLFDPTGGNVLSRHVASSNEKGDQLSSTRYIDSLIGILAILYAVLCLALYFPLRWALPSLVEEPYLVEAGRLLPWLLATLFLNVLSYSTIFALDGLQRADQRGMIMIASQLFFLVFAAILVPQYGVFGLAWAQIIQFGGLLLSARLALMRKIEPLGLFPTHFHWSSLKAVVGYGVKVQGANWAGYLGDPLTRLLLARFGGIEPTAIYEIASKIVVQVRFVIASAAVPLTARYAAFSVSDRASIGDDVAGALAVNIRVVAVMMVLTAIATPVLGYILLGEVPFLFVAFVGLLMAGWSINSLNLPLYLMGQGLDVLRYNIAGNAMVAIGTVSTAALFAGRGDGLILVSGFAIGLMLGSVVIMRGNARILDRRLRDVFPTAVLIKWWIPAALATMIVLVVAFALD